MAAFYISDAKIDKVAEDIGIAWQRGDDIGLIVRVASSSVDCQPDVAEPKKRWLSITQYRGREHASIKGDRARYVANDERIRHDELRFSTLIRTRGHAGLLSQGWYPSAIHLAKISIRDSGQGPSPLGGGGGMMAPPIPRMRS
jgi:hypothetical protein